MAFNPFIGREQPQLEADLRAAQDELAAGKSVTSSAEGGGSVSTQREASIMQRIEMLLRALNLLDPATYPIDSITRIRSTRIVFSE